MNNEGAAPNPPVVECHERLVLGFTYVQTNLLDS